jgi:hypothetical protein
VVGRHHGDGRQHRTGARNEHQAQAEAEDEAPGTALLVATGKPGEGSLEDVPDRGHDEAEPHDAEDDEPDPPQEIEGKPQGGEQQGPG